MQQLQNKSVSVFVCFCTYFFVHKMTEPTIPIPMAIPTHPAIATYTPVNNTFIHIHIAVCRYI